MNILYTGMYLKRLWGEVGNVLTERIRLSGKASDAIQEQVYTRKQRDLL